MFFLIFGFVLVLVKSYSSLHDMVLLFDQMFKIDWLFDVLRCIGSISVI